MHDTNEKYDDEVTCTLCCSSGFLQPLDIESEEKSSCGWDNVDISDIFLMRIEVSLFAIWIPDRCDQRMSTL